MSDHRTASQLLYRTASQLLYRTASQLLSQREAACTVQNFAQPIILAYGTYAHCAKYRNVDNCAG